MKIPRYSLIRILVDGMNYKKGELARYSHQFMRFDPTGGIVPKPKKQRCAINVLRGTYVSIYEGQFEVVPGYMKFNVGDEVYISTMNTTYGGKPFKVIGQENARIYNLQCGELETLAPLGELIPVRISNKHSKSVLSMY